MKKGMFLLLMVVSLGIFVMAQGKDAIKDEKTFLEKVLSGKVYFKEKHVEVTALAWNPHPTFKGVYLKNLVTGKDTGDQLSCHIVKIEPNYVLDTHLHDGKIEIHEVVGGNGIMYLEDEKIHYSVGRTCVIPANTLHKVVAGKDGLYLLAKFTPAL
ncbi:MAG: AraC family ligand binding domain-containing protein [Bacteroidales bacterium]|jgi:quercetin dioxygenase-like cupin family protein|nr:AraC family ligand binding domain-containing protein [Bacteroidales bacterium]